MYFKTEGVILLQKNFGEADKLLTVYTKDQGKITCIAKGVRKPASKKSGHIDLGNWCKMFVVRGKNIDLLTEVEVKKAFGVENLKTNKANNVYHLLEIVNMLTPQGQKSPKVFFLLLNFLKEVSGEDDFNTLSSIFKIRLLKNLGYFSSSHLESSKFQQLLSVLEEKDFGDIKGKINITDASYLKLLSFLDSIIEIAAERKLKTARFINGQL